MQEAIRYRKLPHDKLAHQMSISELMLRDAVGRTMGLTRGQCIQVRAVCSVFQQRMSYEPASEMVRLAGKAAPARPRPLRQGVAAPFIPGH